MPDTIRLLFDPNVRIQGTIGENTVSDFLMALKAIRAYSRAGARMIGADRWPLSHWSDIEAVFGRPAEALAAAPSPVDPDAGSGHTAAPPPQRSG